MSKISHRLISIDAMRGLVIILMLLDHVRETFFLHQQVSDPIDVQNTALSLFASRSLAHICAPVFVLLTGISAALYGSKVKSTKNISSFLFKRGLLLILLEVTVINFAWTFQFPPHVIYLQVIWAIGLSMVALSALVWFDKKWIIIIGFIIIIGHNLLDTIHFSTDSIFYIPWAIMHDRGWIEWGNDLRIRTSYPVLPWIGIIAIGYAFGSIFSNSFSTNKRQYILIGTGFGCLILFFVLRIINVYGEKHWQSNETFTQTLMSFFNITKYPPSLVFIVITLGLGFLILALLEKHSRSKLVYWLSIFGSVPMFFYIFHLYVLKVLYILCSSTWGLNQGKYFGFNSILYVWICTLFLIIILYFPVRCFSQFKTQHREITWLKYF